MELPGPRTPKAAPLAGGGAKDYSFPHIRCFLRRKRIGSTIPRRRDHHRGNHFGKAICKSRASWSG